MSEALEDGDLRPAVTLLSGLLNATLALTYGGQDLTPAVSSKLVEEMLGTLEGWDCLVSLQGEEFRQLLAWYNDNQLFPNFITRVEPLAVLVTFSAALAVALTSESEIEDLASLNWFQRLDLVETDMKLP
jgi:hypothetical protein